MGGSTRLRPADDDEHPQRRRHGHEDDVRQPQRERQQRTHQIVRGRRSGTCGARLLALRVRSLVGGRGGETERSTSHVRSRSTRRISHSIGPRASWPTPSLASSLCNVFLSPAVCGGAGTVRGGRRRASEEGDCVEARSIPDRVAANTSFECFLPKTVTHCRSLGRGGGTHADLPHKPGDTISLFVLNTQISAIDVSFRAPLKLKLLVEPRVPTVAEFRALADLRFPGPLTDFLREKGAHRPFDAAALGAEEPAALAWPIVVD
ncbi:hypothetical protein B0H17DRAFT_1150874 [Mycena rosella]|uniref:Uncharacterized protein n=1 Tax=Mycena rosella TaxID=1033263 RepID=A0AAD7BQQ8_MYCRO|nr:hypothetical protein B0H17DRAFT_1150874 [Mycena rosella]